MTDFDHAEWKDQEEKRKAALQARMKKRPGKSKKESESGNRQTSKDRGADQEQNNQWWYGTH